MSSFLPGCGERSISGCKKSNTELNPELCSLCCTTKTSDSIHCSVRVALRKERIFIKDEILVCFHSFLSCVQWEGKNVNIFMHIIQHTTEVCIFGVDEQHSMVQNFEKVGSN